MKPFKKVIQLELNEISYDLLKRNIEVGRLPNFSLVDKNWQRTKTSSEKEYDLLEPWIQWVTAHTGKPFSDHNIFHLGDATNLQADQIWEVLSDHRIESAIIGSMNTKRGRAQGGVYIPDPWSKDGATYPEKLQGMWRFIAKRVQSHAVTSTSFTDLLSGLNSIFDFQVPLPLCYRIGTQIVRQKVDQSKKWALAALFDEFLFAIFDNILEETQFGFNALFLNAMAHYQHHYWRQHEKDIFNPDILCPDCSIEDDPILFGLETYDRILGQILDKYSRDPSTLIVILTGLSQMPYLRDEAEGGMHYFRLRDHRRFVDELGLKGIQVFPLMSRDWQFSADSAERLELAHSTLSSLKVMGAPLFTIKKNGPTSFFVETAITKGHSLDSFIENEQERSIGKMGSWFVSIAVKSGYHSGIGYFWSSYPILDARQIPVMPLTDVFGIGLKSLGVT